jgi:hypothetical protein
MHLWRGPPSVCICPEPQVAAAAAAAAVPSQPPVSMATTTSKVQEQTSAEDRTMLQERTADAELDKERDFYSIGVKTHTDKVAAVAVLPICSQNATIQPDCPRGTCQRITCRTWGHFYHTLYQSRMGKYSKMSVKPFQFLEIGFFNGAGADTYRQFFPRAEVHSLEIACLPEGPMAEGKWPWGNFAAKHKDYETLRKTDRLHCGDANNVTFLDKVWNTHMKRPDAPPLTIVVDDGSHLAAHMAQSVFYWFPKIQPGGLMVVEDIQPIDEANWFRTRFLPKIMSDLHFCGDPQQQNDTIFFPTIQPRLASIHCEMHICVFERNEEPAVDLSLEESTIPRDVWKDDLFLNTWGSGT